MAHTPFLFSVFDQSTSGITNAKEEEKKVHCAFCMNIYESIYVNQAPLYQETHCTKIWWEKKNYGCNILKNKISYLDWFEIKTAKHGQVD